MPVDVWESIVHSDTLITPPTSSEQCTSATIPDLSPNHGRSESPSSVRRRRRLVGPDFASRRNGTINILGVDSAWESRRSSSSSPGTTRPHTQPLDNDRRPSVLGSPVIHVTHDTTTPVRDDSTFLGRWQCCECHRGHGVYESREGQHLISILSCLCPHRSCKNCTFQGRIKRFAPIYDVEGSASMPTAGERGEGVYMGIVCRSCGLSWQAQKIEAPKRSRSFRQRLSILPKKVNPMTTLRHARSMIHLGLPRDPQPDARRPGTALPISRSFLNLRSVSDAQARESNSNSNPEAQAENVQVRFYGIECTCGCITDERSVCFVFFDMVETDLNGGWLSQRASGVEKSSEPSHLPKLRNKGYGTPTLHLKGGAHPNPLLSNPVQGHISF